jgi:hypothetical protein
MGILTYVLEHHPQARMNRVIYDMQQSRGGVAGFKSFGHESLGFVTDVSTIGQSLISRGRSLSGKTRTDAGIRQGLFYDPGNVDDTSFGITGYYIQQLSQSRSQDEKSGASAPSVKPRTLRGNSKPSRPVSSGQSFKPFWANGKPKCKKGFSYDFKRKLCVKIK